MPAWPAQGWETRGCTSSHAPIRAAPRPREKTDPTNTHICLPTCMYVPAAGLQVRPTSVCLVYTNSPYIPEHISLLARLARTSLGPQHTLPVRTHVAMRERAAARVVRQRCCEMRKGKKWKPACRAGYLLLPPDDGEGGGRSMQIFPLRLSLRLFLSVLLRVVFDVHKNMKTQYTYALRRIEESRSDIIRHQKATETFFAGANWKEEMCLNCRV